MTKHVYAPTEPMVYAKALVLSAGLWQLAFVGHIAGLIIYRDLDAKSVPGLVLLFCALTVTAQIAYSYLRGFGPDAARIMRSKRADLVIMLLFGLAIGMLLAMEVEVFYTDFLNRVGAPLLLLISLSGIALPLAHFFRAFLWRATAVSHVTLLDDREIQNASDDVFDLDVRAADFAAHVTAANSSVIFGIDAPWGTGKSSFINLCSNHWGRARHIVYRFEPLRYTEDTNLIDRFLTGLINEIQKHSFVPELRPALNRYARAIKGNAEVGFSVAKLNLESGGETVDDMLEDLACELARVQAKVIVVVDDLDRIGAESAKKVLFAIKKSFNLPNVSYVLCYDTEILSQESQRGVDSVAAREFLEKFVSVKIGLFIGPEKLVSYMRGKLLAATKEMLLLTLPTAFTLNSIITTIADSYQKENGWRYRKLLGDPRKVKRFVNLLLLLRIGEIQFEEQDFNNTDLLNLLLLYLTYPRTFRAIHASEIDGQQGIFAIKRKYENGGYKSKNHADFEAYLEKCEPDEKFLLESLFKVELVVHTDSFASDDEEIHYRTRACYNDAQRRNLERYLRLIVDLKAPDPHTSLSFYLKHFKELKDGKAIDYVLRRLDSSNEKIAGEFWRVVAARAGELTCRQAVDLIEHLIRNLPSQSILESAELAIGIRDANVLTLLRILDEAGWQDENSLRRNNSEQNVLQIAYWIFGSPTEDRLTILQSLSEETRGLLGLHDLLLFRLYCHPGRGSLFNISKALILHANPSARTDGLVSELNKSAIRELSQKIFQIFEKRYILGLLNIFDEAKDLSVEQLAGKFAPLVRQQQGDSFPASLNKRIQVTRTSVLNFCVYQLTNRFTGDSGVGCGFYDRSGDGDAGGISVVMNAWAAAGFIDTLLRWKMKLEVGHGNEKEIQPGVQIRGCQAG